MKRKSSVGKDTGISWLGIPQNGFKDYERVRDGLSGIGRFIDAGKGIPGSGIGQIRVPNSVI